MIPFPITGKKKKKYRPLKKQQMEQEKNQEPSIKGT